MYMTITLRISPSYATNKTNLTMKLEYLTFYYKLCSLCNEFLKSSVNLQPIVDNTRKPKRYK